MNTDGSCDSCLCLCCTVPSDFEEIELGSSDQEASLSAGKNARVVLVPCHA